MSIINNRITKITYHVVMYHQDCYDTHEYDKKFEAKTAFIDY